jgi:hypothetical protein
MILAISVATLGAGLSIWANVRWFGVIAAGLFAVLVVLVNVFRRK